jgi:hypothetical protein
MLDVHILIFNCILLLAFHYANYTSVQTPLDPSKFDIFFINQLHMLLQKRSIIIL